MVYKTLRGVCRPKPSCTAATGAGVSGDDMVDKQDEEDGVYYDTQLLVRKASGYVELNR